MQTCYLPSLSDHQTFRVSVGDHVTTKPRETSRKIIVATWRHGFGSTLAQVMVCCLATPSHHLNQCWIVISRALCHPPEGNVSGNTNASNQYSTYKNTYSKLKAHLLGVGELKYIPAQIVKMSDFTMVTVSTVMPLSNVSPWEGTRGTRKTWTSAKTKVEVVYKAKHWPLRNAIYFTFYRQIRCCPVWGNAI